MPHTHGRANSNVSQLQKGRCPVGAVRGVYMSIDEQWDNIDDSQQNRYLAFALDEEDYGIDIRYVTEIIGVQPITRLPEVPKYIKGIINLRGKVVPVIDMRLKFHKESVPYNDRTCVIVIEVQELTAGLIVDSVTEVLTIEGFSIVPPPEHSSMGVQNKYISGIGRVGNEIKLLLDCEKIFYEEGSPEETREVK